MPRHALGLILLVLVTGIWGSTFAIVKSATEVLSPAALVAWRFALAGLILLPLLRLPARRARGAPAAPAGTPAPRSFLRDSAWLGLLLIIGYATQTIALQTTSANRAAFITGLNVVIVPLWLAAATGRRITGRLWGAAALALGGIALLSWEGGTLVIGDLWALACAVSYAAYILLLERAAPHHPPLAFTASQVLVVAGLAFLWLGLTEPFSLPPAAAWAALIYLGIVATAVTTLLQTLGQRWVSATEAAILYALEPVAASVFSFLLLSEVIGPRGLLGGALVVAGMVLSQLPGTLRRRPRAARDRGLAE